MARKEGHVSIFWLVVLVLAVIWLLNDLNVLSINIPWLPVLLIVIALGAIFNRMRGH